MGEIKEFRRSMSGLPAAVCVRRGDRNEWGLLMNNDLAFRVLSSIGRHWPLNRGHFALTSHPLVSWSVPRVPESAGVPLRSGLRISVDLSDYNGRMLGLFGNVEPTITRICRSLLKPGWSFLDIGANYGGVGLNCFDVVGPNGQVHFFEPQRDLCDRIQQCIVASGLPWLFVHPVGLLDRDGTLVLRRPVGHSGGAGFFHRDDTAATETVAPLRSFNDYVRPLISGRRFGAKLDVEGAEIFILPHALQSDGFGFATFECNVAQERPPLWECVRESGCLLFGIPASLVQVRVERIDRVAEMAKYSDFLAVKSTEWLRAGSDRSLALRELSRAL